MKEVFITAYPYAVQHGTIEVPDNITEDEMKDYIRDHFDDIPFDEPDLDYCGTDFDINY